VSARPLSLTGADRIALAGEESGEGQPIVLLHGLTATRRYVLMGSKLLQRSGHRVIAYDARAHGRSDPAPATAYTYAHLSADLLSVLEQLQLERAVVVGASMGAHTAVRLALEHPQRVAGLVLITPAFEPDEHGDFAGWDALARGLREGGVEGFMAAYDFAAVPHAWRETVEKVVRQRLSQHEHSLAVADALESVPRSRPFERIEQLRQIACPAVVVASRDEADPSHPLAVAERYVQAIPHATLVIEEAGPPPRSPIAWQGGQLSKVVAELARRVIG
jgi:pimeloyl-ACP methyl ester carboxylesterase